MKRYATQFYKVTAIAVLNTLVLLIAVELLAGTIINIVNLPAIKNLISKIAGQPNDMVAFYQSLPYYVQQDWSSGYWQDHKSALRKTYFPYVIWRNPRYRGATLNIDQYGIRNTPGSACAPHAFKVFVFGGSSIWGWGAPDWSTIPAILQSRLGENLDQPLCVVNYGENAYVSTQSMIQLILLLESGNVPDVVIFYDGVNDVLSASQSGKPLVHQNLLEIAGLFQDSQPPLVRLAQNLNTYQLIEMILSQIDLSVTRPDSNPDYLPEQLADQIVEAYLNNMRIIRSLATTFDFECYFFWQPYILIGNKPLSPEERAMISELDWVLDLNPRLVKLFGTTYQNIESAASSNENLYYLGNIFDNEREPVWIDTWGHITPKGNEIVVDEMLVAIKGSTKE